MSFSVASLRSGGGQAALVMNGRVWPVAAASKAAGLGVVPGTLFARRTCRCSRLGGQHIDVVVPKEEGGRPMSVRNHNGVDVHRQAEVDRAHELVKRDAEKWGLHQISKLMVQHGTYSFYFWDRDDNSWEILCNPPGGYSWLFERGDQEGRGTQDENFARPDLEPGE